MTTPTIIATFRARKALAERHTPGGKLTREDLRGIIRTTANIHRVDVPTVMAELVEEGEI